MEKHSKGRVKDTVNYARKYGCCLLNEDFSQISSFSNAKRRRILAALSNLSKFLGRYEDFQRLFKGYGLKWQTAKAEDLLIARMTSVEEKGSLRVPIGCGRALHGFRLRFLESSTNEV